jgi:hypothetical protein
VDRAQACHEHAVKHRKYYVPIDIAYIGAMARGVRKLAGSPFRAKYKPAETCPVCVLVAAAERARVEEMRQFDRAYEEDARRRQAYADDVRRVTYIVQRDDESPDTFHVVTDQGEIVESFTGTIEHQGHRTDARTRALERCAELNRK